MNNEEILEEYSRYKYVVENIKDIIWEMDKNLIFTFVSPIIKNLVGYEVKELIGKSLFEFLTKESIELVVEQLSLRKCADESKIIKELPLLDIEFICSGGHTMWYEVCIKSLYEDEKIIRYIGAARDISEKKMHENKLKEMLEEQRRINEQLEDLLTLDLLTGAYNRRKLEVYLKKEIEKVKEYGDTFSISIFDIDNFKKINDMNGHDKGDKVLQDITGLIKHTLRETDKLFRWGGDEFIIVFSDVDLKNAFKVADKVREVIESYEFDIESKSVTISMGVGAYMQGETSDQVVARVDKALLRAKKNGKNIVEVD